MGHLTNFCGKSQMPEVFPGSGDWRSWNSLIHHLYCQVARLLKSNKYIGSEVCGRQKIRRRNSGRLRLVRRPRPGIVLARVIKNRWCTRRGTSKGG